MVGHGGRGSGWGRRSRLRLKDQERTKSWEETEAADSVFSCAVALLNRPLNLHLGLLEWALRWEMVRAMRMNGGAGP